MFKNLPIAMLAVATAALMTPTDAAATVAQNGAGACQGALPVYATNLRARPLGVNNEGTSGAYVSCSLHTIDLYQADNDINGVMLSNRGGADANVDCVMVSSGSDVGTAVYFPKSITVPAGATNVELSWNPATDNGGANFPNTINYSCLLPPGIDVNFVFSNLEQIPA